MTSPRWLTCCAVMLLTAASACRGAIVSEQVSLEMCRRGESVRQRLSEGLPVRAVIFGDSISDGYGTDGSHVYHRMALDALRYRHPHARIDATVVATPGQTTGEALSTMDRRVLSLQPDLVVVQFGGNDKGWGRPLNDFRRDYAVLLSRLSQSTDAVVVACLPPIAEVPGDNAWSRAAREVATREGVPWADFHRAIGDGPRDFRGSFPYQSHPGSFTHVVMAKALLAAVDRALGVEPAFECRLHRETRLSADATQVVEAEIVSQWRMPDTGPPEEFDVRLQLGEQSVDLRARSGADGRAVISHSFKVPGTMPAGRAFAIPVHLYVRDADYGSFDVAWLTIAPAVAAPSVATPAPGAERAWQHLGADDLTIGRHLWGGPRDVSGRFTGSVTADFLRLEIHVADDDVTVADLTDPSRGDSVEVYLDLRDAEAQGRPLYDPDVLALQVIPPLNGPVRWRNMHALPADLQDIAVTGAITEGGYRVRLDVPVAAIESRRGEQWGGIGVDVGINDADNGGWRRCQMMWTGTADNYINPGFLGGLWPGTIPAGATRRVIQ